MGIGGLICHPNLIPLCLGDSVVQRLSAIALLQNLPVRCRCHPFIVELEPPAVLVWFDESKATSTIKITRVYDYTLKLVLPGSGSISGLVEEFSKVDFQGEFEAIIDLPGRVRTIL